MAQEQMQQARELIKAKRYDEARAILRNVDSPFAEEWLERIDQLDPPAKDKPDWLASVGSAAEKRTSDHSMRDGLESNPVIQPD